MRLRLPALPALALPALALLALALVARPVVAQSFGPGLGNLTYDTSELFQPLAVFQHPNGYTSSTMVHGWFLTVTSGDNNPAPKGIELWDLSDPRSPQLAYQHTGAGTPRLHEAHTFGLSSAASYGEDYLCFMSSRGFQMWNFSDPARPFSVGETNLPGITSEYGAIFWLFWAPPYVYVPGAGAGLFVVRVDDPTDLQYVKTIPPSQLGGIAPNQVFVCGNLMILVRSQQLGFATFDISDPENPVPLQVVPGAQGYSHIFAAGKILTSGGDGGPVQMFVHDVGPDGEMSLVGSVGSGFSNGAYGSYQDGFFHTGMSNAYAKFDVANLQLVGSATTNITNRDEDQCQVLGNLAFVGDDHGVGSGLYVHDTSPDSKGPDVAWVHPADGATGVALTGRVGLSMSDSVDFLSVDGTSFVVRPLGGQPLPGKFATQMGLVNFFPDQPLAPDTVYEVVVSGIEDYVGNSGAAFQSRFTTRSALGGSGGPSGGPVAVANLSAAGPATYTSELLDGGDLLYVDRTYTYDAFPARFAGQTVVQTANDDKAALGPAFLSFDLAEPAEVCVLFDDRATALPAWLQGWSPTGESTVSQCQPYGPCTYLVYSRELPAGPVVLGGNGDPPVAGAGSMYTVVVLPSSAPPTVGPPLVAPSATGAPANFSADGVSGAGPFTYAWSFGDGTPQTAPSPDPSTTHVYAEPGRYPVVVSVIGANGATASSAIQVVYDPPTPEPPSRSGPIATDGTRVAVVNPDNDTVSAIDADTLALLWEVPVGDHPRTLSFAPDGSLWVANVEDATLTVLDGASGAQLGSVALPRGSRPHGVLARPDGTAVYVGLEGGAPLAAPRAGRLARTLAGGPGPGPGAPAARATGAGLPPLAHVLELDPASGAVRRAALPSDDGTGGVRGLALSGDGSRLFATRFLTRNPAQEGVVYELDSAELTPVATHALHFDQGPDTERSGRGAPNYLSALAISPDGASLLVPSKKDNVARGLWRDGQPLSFESRVRTIVSRIDLVAGAEDEPARLDLNDRDGARAAAFTPLGDLFAVAVQGSDVVDVFDAHTGAQYATYSTGKAPQGLLFSADGTRLYVKNFLGRSISVFDTEALVAGETYAAPLIAEVPTVASEALAPDVLAGKRIFYDARDRRMNLDGYLSCASCHLDGEADGQTWDFTQSGEGLRNTIPLVGRAGTGHGNVHWTANFDEIQDFENDIRQGFLGVGFLLDPDFLATAAPLGAPKAGLSTDLDALASYVSSLDRFPVSPWRAPDGSLSPEAQAGQALFTSLGCASCHVPPSYTDGLRHDVGTILPSSGLGIGQPLAGVGFETPTLRGLWNSAPYLHDGRADLLTVLDSAAHGGTDSLDDAQRRELALFLLQLE